MSGNCHSLDLHPYNRAAGVPHQWLRISFNLWIVLHLCWAPGANGDVQVPDGVVYTELQRTAEIGEKLVLTCRFYGTPIAVYWKKGVDPTTAPNLITWVEGESASGSCVNDRSCNITGDYSLVIRSVKVSDQGSYICRVSNYLGVLIHNFTEVTVFAAPSKPYPLIEECQPVSNGLQSCRLPASDSVTITCTASRYFPDIDLFFLHESITTNATYSQISEETNVDGTKNKSVSIVARPSENPYVCVASRIPGSQDRRTVSVTVHTIESTVAMTMMTTAQTNQTSPPYQRHGAAKVVVPLILILLAVLVCIFIWWYRKRRTSKQGKGDLELSPLHPIQDIKGKVSFYELWHLIHHMETKYSGKLREALIYLKICRAEDELSADKAYNLLCQWKDTNTYDDEAAVLKNALVGHGLQPLWEKMCDERYEATYVPDKSLNRILWNIGGDKQVRSFFRELLRDPQETPLDWFGKESDGIKDATKYLRKWCDKEHEVNKNVQLSLALERADFKPLDREYFEDLEVPENLQQEIGPDEIQKCVYRLAERHVRRLAVAVKITDENQISTIIGENKDALWVVEQMINDWLIGQECGNYEKRCKLDDAIIEIGRHDMTDSFGTTSCRAQSGDDHKREHSYANYFDCSSLFDDDIESLLRYLPTGAIPMFLEKLRISRSQGDDDQNEKLRCWRDERMRMHKGCYFNEITAILIQILKETNNIYVLSLNDDDLENVVASTTSIKQIDALALKIGMEPGKKPQQILKDWRDGSKEDKRDILWKALNATELSGCIVHQLPSEHVYQVEMVCLAWNLFSIDVLSLANLLNININRQDFRLKGTVKLLMKLFEKSETLNKVRRLDFSVAIRSLGYLDVARSVYFGYDASLSELCNMVSGLLEDEIVKLMDNLELERDALSVCKGTTGEYDIVRLMEIWKRRHSSGPFHYRLKLAFGLRAAGKTEIARKIIAGIGIFDMVKVSPDVVKNICDGMGDDQLERLAEHLGLKAKGGNSSDTSALVIQWATEWFSKAYRSSLLDSFNPFTSEEKSRRKEIDNLFKAGFDRLAEELMLLEVSRLSLIKQGQMTLSDDFVDERCESKNQETSEQMESENNLPSEACSEDSSTGVQGTPCNNENEDKQL